MNWSLFRGLCYAATFGASLLALGGYATYDASTGVLDLHPFNVKEVVQNGLSVLSSGLAGLALWKGWGKK